MIAYINGQITHQAPTQVIVEVGGLGYDVQISLHTYAHLKDLAACKLFTYLHITADAHTLYGFADIAEKQWFLHLLQVNGIGPRMAMTILSSLTPKELQQAILGHHTGTLQAIKGIGQKVAQRIILELSGKVGKLADLEEVTSYHSQEALRQEALVALSKLGINKIQAEKAILQIIKTHPGELTLETVIKLALKA
jgi:Holliday junction DNA helicase RuvA